VGVHGDLVHGGITDETLVVGEGHIGGCCAITLVVGDDVNTIVYQTPTREQTIIVAYGGLFCRIASKGLWLGIISALATMMVRENGIILP